MNTSWVIREKANKAVVFETWSPKLVAALNTDKYEAVPIQQYLGSLNRAIWQGEDAIVDALRLTCWSNPA